MCCTCCIKIVVHVVQKLLFVLYKRVIHVVQRLLSMLYKCIVHVVQRCVGYNVRWCAVNVVQRYVVHIVAKACY